MEGWIKLHRKILDCRIFAGEPYSKMQAWIYLLLMANHEPKDIFIGYKKLHLERGQFHTSERKLAEVWRWDFRKVKRFLDGLEMEKMLSRNSTTYGSTITIEKYDFYQVDGSTNSSTNSSTNGSTNGTQTRKKELKNNILLFSNSVLGRNITPELQEKLSSWMEYKQQRKEYYVETGMKSFLTQMEKAEARYGTTALCNCIDTCMGRQYKGIILDLIDKEKGRGTTNVEPTVRRYPDAIECNITPEEVGTTPRYYNGIE